MTEFTSFHDLSEEEQNRVLEALRCKHFTVNDDGVIVIHLQPTLEDLVKEISHEIGYYDFEDDET